MRTSEEEGPNKALKLKEQRKVLLLLATFATGISYAAGLSPPGGFHNAGKPTLKAHQCPRLMAFFYCNTASFVALLLTIVLLLGRRLQRYYARMQLYLYGFIIVVLLGLLCAYAAGSSVEGDTKDHMVVLVALVLLNIFLAMIVKVLVSDHLKNTCS